MKQHCSLSAPNRICLIDNGEIWRFITPIFIHIGLLHLAFNSYALWIVGPQVEKLYGGARFLRSTF